MSHAAPTIGVLALQGDVREHLRALTDLGADARPVRRAAELADVSGIVIPGGESTTMCRLLDVFELRVPLGQRLAEGMPAYGSCAGMIVLASRILDGREDQRPLGALDITVRRNAFGRQVDSFEVDLPVAGIAGGPMRTVFIRAPWVEAVGPEVEVLASVRMGADGAVLPSGAIAERDDALAAPSKPVAVRQGAILATSFHPEVTADPRIHQLFVELVRASARSRPPSVRFAAT